MELIRQMKGENITVYGADERIGALTHKVSHNEIFKVRAISCAVKLKSLFCVLFFKIGNLDVSCLHTPCHTTGHICYVVKDTTGQQVVFTGQKYCIEGLNAKNLCKLPFHR